MALDPQIEQAIKKATAEYNQSEDVASIIASWFRAIINGNENLDNIDEAYGRLDMIFDAMTVDEAQLDLKE